MEKISFNVGIALMLSGLGVIYLSRFLLRNHTKLTGVELKKLNPELGDVHQTYYIFNTLTVLSFAFVLFLVYQSNRAFWEERVFFLFTLVSIVFALFDGIFALKTKVFPATTRYNWNNYVYDANKKLSWVAYWQIGLSIILLMANFVFYALML